MSPIWSQSSSSIFNWNILTSVVTTTDLLGINFTVVADDTHAIRALDDFSGWRSKDTMFTQS